MTTTENGTAPKVPQDIESQTYQRELPRLLVHSGKFAVVHGDVVEDVFESYDDALKHGYRRFGLERFLIKRIEATEQVHTITRLIVPCPI